MFVYLWCRDAAKYFCLSFRPMKDTTGPVPVYQGLFHRDGRLYVLDTGRLLIAGNL